LAQQLEPGGEKSVNCSPRTFQTHLLIVRYNTRSQSFCSPEISAGYDPDCNNSKCTCCVHL